MALQHLRSSTANKRPIPTQLSAGQIAVNTNEASPGLFFKDSNGDLVKIGPVHVGTSAPNSSPASTAATALVSGTVYQILTVGTTDFTAIGASANTVGTVFTATGAGTGTGTVSGQQGNEKGEQWLDTTGGAYDLKIYDGSAWRSQAGEFVNHTGDTMTGVLQFVSGSASAPGIAFSGDTNTGIFHPGADSVAVTTGGTQRVTIDSSGRLLVGTTTPGDAAADNLTLHSSGDTGITIRASETDSSSIYFADGTGGTNVYTGAIIYDHATDHMSLHTNSGSERLRIGSNGNVSVGTSTTNQAKLHVENGSFSTIFKVSSAGAQTAYGIYQNSATGFGTTDGYFVGVGTDGTGYVWNYENLGLGFGTNNTERLRIDSSGNMGLGINSPSSRLHVKGAADSYLTLQAGTTDGNDGVLFQNSGGTQKGALLYDTDDNYLLFNVNSAERLRIDSSGQVGIGTSNPVQQSGIGLHINNVSGQARLKLTSSSTGATANDGVDLIVETNNEVHLLNHEAAALKFGTSDSEKMRIDGSGRVGIGNTTMSSFTGNSSDNLVVGGGSGSEGITVYSAAQGSLTFADGTSGNAAYRGAVEYNHTADQLAFRTAGTGNRMVINSSGRVGIGESSPAANLEITPGTGAGTLLLNYASGSMTDGALNIEVGSGGVLYETRKTGGLAHIWYATGTERMRIDSSGRVGIGTTNPSSILHLESASTPTITLIDTTNTCKLLAYAQNSNAHIGTYSNHELIFDTNSTEKMRIDSSGNVGVGTSSPAYNIHGSGYLGLGTQASAGSGAGIHMIPSSTLTNWFVGSNYVTPGTFQIIPSTAGGGSTFTTPSLTIDSSGRLLVGISSSVDSNSTLQVEGRNTITAIRYSATTGNAGSKLELSRSASNTVGTTAAVAATDELGEVRFRGATSSSTFNTGAVIAARVESGTISSSSLPTALLFSTTANGSASSTERMRIDSSGNVGIGETNPATKLHLKLDTNKHIRFQGNIGEIGSVPGFQGVTDAGALAGLGMRGSDLRFATGSSERMRIDSSGRLLVGTGSSPTAGGGAIAKSVIQGNTSNSAGAGYLSLQRGQAAASISSGETLGLINFADSAGNDYAIIKGRTGATGGSNDYPGELVFGTAADGASTTTDRMVIDSSGRVGIGTTSPGVPLDISSNDSTANLRITDNTNGARIKLVAASTQFDLYNTGGAGYIGTPTNSDILIATNNTERLRIDSSGNIGIGTSSPLKPLHVSQAGDCGIMLQTTNAADNYEIWEIIAGANASNHADLIFKTRANNGAGGDEAMRILRNGNVGIGTTSPSQKLHVQGSGQQIFKIRDTGVTNGLDIGNNTSQSFISTIDAKPIAFYTSNSERMRIDSSGRLLLGTTTEGHDSADDLTIATTGDTGITIRSGTSDQGNIFFSDGTSGTNEYRGAVRYYHDVDELELMTAASGKMKIKSYGQVFTYSTSVNAFAIASAGATTATNACIYLQAGATGIDTGTITFKVQVNGNVQNANNSYTGISDVKLKENIVDANSQWSDIKAIQVRNYNYKEETELGTHTQIGVIAQEIESISPGLVIDVPDVGNDGIDPGTTTKSVNYSVLYMKAVKALQEAMDRIETLEAKVAALEAA